MEKQKIKIPPEWKRCVEEIDGHGGPVLVMGAQGSGKSTFCQFLTGHFTRQAKVVAWIDADPGQPFLGPPAALSLAVYAEPEDLLKQRKTLAMSFVGDTSPAGHLLEMITGVQKLYRRAAALDPGLILVNTCGLVNGAAARDLMFHEIDSLSPQYIVALGSGNEVEHLLAPHSHREGLLVIRIPLSLDAKKLSRDARRVARERRFKEYFRGAGFHDLALSDVGVHGPGLGTGERLGFWDVNRLSQIVQGIVVHAEISADCLFMLVNGEYEGEELYTAREQYNVREVTVLKQSEMDHLLVGLNDEKNLCLALGIMRDIDLRDQSIRLISPLRDMTRVRHLSIGTLRVNPAGGELGRW